MKEFKDINDMVKEIELDMKQNHRFDYWIDYKLFRGKSFKFFTYAPHYEITHPWKIVQDIWYEIKWAWQRVFRGWDDRVVWSIDWYLSRKLPEWLSRLKETKQGIPVQFFDEDDWNDEKYEFVDGAEEKAMARWDNILNQIIDGFESYCTMENEVIWKNHPRYNELNNKFENGFNLLKENFGSLWD